MDKLDTQVLTNTLSPDPLCVFVTRRDQKK